MKVFIGDMGNSCNLNYQHIPIYLALSQYCDLTQEIEEADAIVFAETCCTTEYNIASTLECILSSIEKKKDGAKIYLTGCITRKFKDVPSLVKVEKFLEEQIDYIIPQNQHNLLLRLILQDEYQNRAIDDFGMVNRYSSDQAEIYIANGCLNNCSFCKTTFQNYPLKSVDISEVKEAIDNLDEDRVSHVCLKATNICQYGLDIYHEYMISEIIEYLEKKENIKNVSLIGFSFKDAIKNNFAPILRESKKITQLCGSLESGSDRLLSMIRKGFTSDEIISFADIIRQKYYKQLHLNIIAGFPTEALEDVWKTLDVLKQLNPNIVDICRYTNSSFADSNQYEQLSPLKIQEHTRIYSKVLKRRNISVDIVGQGYKYN